MEKETQKKDWKYFVACAWESTTTCDTTCKAVSSPKHIPMHTNMHGFWVNINHSEMYSGHKESFCLSALMYDRSKNIENPYAFI